MSDVKVMVGIPYSEKPLTIDVFLSWMRLAGTGVQAIAAEGPVPLARHNLARSFMVNEEYTHLLMLDLDHVHDPSIVQHMTKWLASEQQPKVIGGMNFQRKAPYSPCGFMFRDETLGVETITEWSPGLIEVDAIGMGCVLVAREVFEKVGEPYFQFAYVGKRFIGEDIWFCHQARRAGYRIWCDTTLTSPHQGLVMVGEKQFRAWMAENQPNSPKKIVESSIIEEVGR